MGTRDRPATPAREGAIILVMPKRTRTKPTCSTGGVVVALPLGPRRVPADVQACADARAAWQDLARDMGTEEILHTIEAIRAFRAAR